jgi:hypothetical protein
MLPSCLPIDGNYRRDTELADVLDVVDEVRAARLKVGSDIMSYCCSTLI